MPECVEDKVALTKWRANAALALATTAFVAVRSAVAFLNAEATVLSKMQLALLAFCLVVVASFHLINLKSRAEFVAFTRRYLAMASKLDEGEQ